VQLLHERGTYFTDLKDYPYLHANYPPLFIALAWPFQATFGPSLLAPRLLSLLFTLLLAAVVGDAARRLSGSSGTGLAFAGLLLCPWYVQTWAPMARVDMLAFLLSAAGLWWIVRGGNSYWTFPLFWLGFFTKQNALLAPAAVLLDILLDGDRRRFVRALSAFALPLLGLFGILVAATRGEAYRHLVPYTAAAEYEWPRMATSYVELAWGAWPLLLAIGLAAAGGAYRAGRERLLLLYAGLNLVAFATIAKAGAAQNYFIEPWLAIVLAAAAGWPAVRARWAAVPLPALLLAAVAVAHYTGADGHRLPPPIRHPERAADFRELWDTVRDTNGPILSENLALLVVNRKPVLVEPFGMLLLNQRGLFDPARIVRDCEAGAFKLIVSEHRLERLPGFEACLAARYEAFRDVSTYRLFRPRLGPP